MRIKKFRLAEGFAVIFLAVTAVIATASDLSRARPGDPPLEMTPAAGILMAILLIGVGVWLLRDAIRRVT